MKRKVIQQGHNALTITLPSKWIKKCNILSKDFLNIEEQGNALVVSTEKGYSEASSIKFDITGLHERAIDRVIRALYQKGADEVILTYDNKETLAADLKTKISVFEAIQHRLNHLINFEIIEQGEHYCKIHDVATSSSKEYYPIIRRIFLLLREMGAQLSEAIQKNDKELLKSIRHKHDVIAKFVTFCIRTLNKEGYKTGIEGVFTYNPKNIIFYYYALQALHEITDLFNESAKFLLLTEAKLKKETCELFKELLNNLEIFYELFYKFDIEKVNELSKRRAEIEKRFYEVSKTQMSPSDLLFAGRIVEVGHQFAFMVESEIAIRSDEKKEEGNQPQNIR
jgi:phosphate uptake regulator